MATGLICRVVCGGLMAVNASEATKLEPLKGREVMAKISQPRNLKFHKKYFSLLSVARDMADQDYTPEQFRALCTVGAGYCDFIEGDKGMVAIPRSISFASMDETEFERLYQDTLTFICQKWALSESDINQIVNFI